LRDLGCWHNGYFFYTPLYFEVTGLRKEVEDMSDEDLIDEVAELNYFENKPVDRIIGRYIVDPKLSEKDREYLINFYVLFSSEDYLVIGEESEE
jgi:hypothetical protein